MSLSRDGRQEKKLKAYMRAKRALKVRFEHIDWEEDEFNPTIADFKAGKTVLGLPAGVAFDMEVVDENPRKAEDE